MVVTRMLRLRIDSDTLQSVKERAAARGMTVQECVVRSLQRDDVYDRFAASFRKLSPDSEDKV